MSPPLEPNTPTPKDLEALQAVPATLADKVVKDQVASAMASCSFPRECFGVWLVPVALSEVAGASPRLPPDWLLRTRQMPVADWRKVQGGWQCPVEADFTGPQYSGAAAVVVLFLVNNVASVGGVLESIVLYRQTGRRDAGAWPAQMVKAIERVFINQPVGLLVAQLKV